MTIGELKKYLDRYSDDTPCANALWLPEDVTQAAKEQNLPEPNAEQCASVLYDMDHYHDANHGLTWDGLLAFLQPTLAEEN